MSSIRFMIHFLTEHRQSVLNRSQARLASGAISATRGK
jgi:hypothetical protein